MNVEQYYNYMNYYSQLKIFVNTEQKNLTIIEKCKILNELRKIKTILKNGIKRNN